MTNKEASEILCEAISTFNNNPDNLENFRLYLNCHFHEWIERYASTPEDLANEFKNFAEM